MRYLPLLLIIVSTMQATIARADAESDRLREALRNATAQSRALEDQRAALQAKLTSAEQERERLKKQNDTFRAQVKEAEQAYRQAVKDFNDRLAERDESLEKWKTAYGEAASVARTKDADRAKFESEVTTLRASTKACVAKNAQLVKVGTEFARQYEEMNVMEKLWHHEPVFGQKRVDHQNAAQDFRGKILEQKVNP
jgi:chromosome segregation ATPase